MNKSGAEELWAQAAAKIRAVRGWTLLLLEQIGHCRDNRKVWLVEGEPGTVIVEALANPFSAARAAWTAEVLAVLSGLSCDTEQPYRARVECSATR